MQLLLVAPNTDGTQPMAAWRHHLGKGEEAPLPSAIDHIHGCKVLHEVNGPLAYMVELPVHALNICGPRPTP